ncbi:type 1 periplasmic binding fold superfamily protein [Aureitalea sp. L0-47]|uniref:type 1 periplasmic binding fold superfamily protein n=1 Tax=Aureitalea sp. L0-47 TaxID=2816962 RepID=UPI002237128C|nr:type 1 periplasmic binding fold superfamily protein [Aureitalea sp. L0-47]MCW5520540.1 type 1 periplasmic binding fold superfamily protein [Aureitalea sp. L0-47]
MTHKLIKSALILLAIVVASCSDDDGNAPLPVNEEEIITTLRVTLNPIGGGAPITLESVDLDGDGPNAPVIDVSGPLTAGTSYSGTIKLLNETVNPPEDITLEVEGEADEHQFFFVVGGGLDALFTYTNFDGNGNPLGTEFNLDANSASTGTVNFVLRHEPTKPNNGTLAGAGGETDISVTFDLTIQ